MMRRVLTDSCKHSFARRIIWQDSSSSFSTTSRIRQQLSGFDRENPPSNEPTGVPRDLVTMMQKQIDLEPDTLRRTLNKRQEQMLMGDQIFRPERHEMLGPDLACAHFICFRGGRVAFEGSARWYFQQTNDESFLPTHKVDSMKLEAIDASRTVLMNIGIDNLSNLNHLKYLNISECWHIDDWCIDKITAMCKDTLVSLDLSGCPHITDRGLSCLHRLRHLRQLNVANLPGVQNKAMICLLLEELLPNCYITGVDYNDQTVDSEDSALTENQWNEIQKAFIKKHVPALDRLQRWARFLPSNTSLSTKILKSVFPKREIFQ
ncbi:distal membrane arm assembly component 2-like [Tubulanus polymorphus]|uniref:distal membrane arm assembly component 2-like n=1 Tax=Tubulanus polymorphus TaxID=672921 RepID=UPI003DA6349F